MNYSPDIDLHIGRIVVDRIVAEGSHLDVERIAREVEGALAQGDLHASRDKREVGRNWLPQGIAAKVAERFGSFMAPKTAGNGSDGDR